MRYRLERVDYMPAELEPGLLYVSEEFETAAHLCACGCGSKVRTPLGPTEWTFTDTPSGPSLRPSIGNWQRPCRSHYWILDGQMEWSGAWSEGEILAGRRHEEQRRHEYYERLNDVGILARIWRRIKGLFGG